MTLVDGPARGGNADRAAGGNGEPEPERDCDPTALATEDTCTGTAVRDAGLVETGGGRDGAAGR